MRLSIKISRLFLILSDNVSQKLFVDNILSHPETFMAEVGVNTPSLISYINKKSKIKYIGFEPNPVNFKRYKLNNYGVINKAVTINQDGPLDFYVPIYDYQPSNILPESGKGSLISGRHNRKEIKVKVQTIKLDVIFKNYDINTWWIDAEGLSIKILSKILMRKDKPNFIYTESETNDKYLIRNIVRENKGKYIIIRARTSHNQDNYIFLDKNLAKNRIQIYFAIFKLRIYEILFVFIFSIFKIIVKLKNFFYLILEININFLKSLALFIRSLFISK